MNDERLQAVVDRVTPGARLERSWVLEGGVSATMRAVECRQGDGTLLRLVVRKYGAHDWKQAPSAVAPMEFELLARLWDLGVAVPRVRLCDDSDALLGSPFIVMDLVEHTTDAPAPDVAGAHMADVLLGIHAVAAAELGGLLPEREDPTVELAAWLRRDGASDQQLRGVLAFQPASELVLLHGDFWPGNVLWRGETVAAVVDWEDAAVGDRLSDVACARVELLCAWGAEAERAFSQRYLSQVPVDETALCVWDLYVAMAALEYMDQWGLEPSVLEARRRHTEAFRDRALRGLGGAPSE